MHLISRNNLLLLPVLGGGLLFAMSCSDDGNNGDEEGDDAPNQTPALGSGNLNSEIAIVAKDNLFNEEELTAPSNTEVSLELDNQDAGVLHNVSVYQSSDAQEVIFRGDLFPGVETRTFNFETPEPGEYFFRCDVHPDTMTGTFISQATAEAGGSATAEASPTDGTGSTQNNQGGTSQSGVTLRDGNLQVERIDGLSQPTQIAFLGPADLLVTEKTGSVVRVTNGEVQDDPVLELPANYADERGVLGLTLHPEFESNNWVYLYWTWKGEGSIPEDIDAEPTDDLQTVAEFGNRVDRFTWDGTSLTFDQNIIELPSRITDLTMDRTRGNHNAGVIEFGPDGMLYIANGDQNARGYLQNVEDGPQLTGRDALQGVLLRVTDDGSIPEDNPFAQQSDDERRAIYLYGIRNTFGFDFDPESGELWLEANGQASYDVLGRYEAGQNLGWIQIMGPPDRIEDYKELEIDTERKLDNPDFSPEMLADSAEEALDRLVLLEGSAYQAPQLSWRFAVAPTAVEFIQGDALGSDYAGTLLVGDVNTGTLYHFQLSGDRMTLDLQGDLSDGVNDNTEDDPIGELSGNVFGQGIAVATDIEEGPDGTLWVTSSALNAIFQISGSQ